jgi:hypothetical protein
MSRKKDTHLGFFALMIGGLLCSLLLVLILDGTRWLMPRAGTRMIAEFLLSGLDEATAEALSEEIFLSPKGAGDCRLIRIDTVEPEKKQCITADGRILLLPSKKHFSVRITLEIPGEAEEDGFLAFGSLPLCPGTRISLIGERMEGEGLLISLSPLS